MPRNTSQQISLIHENQRIGDITIDARPMWLCGQDIQYDPPKSNPFWIASVWLISSYVSDMISDFLGCFNRNQSIFDIFGSVW